MRKMSFIGLLLLVSSCTHDGADGYFVESRLSPRLKDISASDGNKNFLRLTLKEYASEVGGVLEVFRLQDYDAFSKQPDHYRIRTNNYFCTRLGRSYRKGENYYITFNDSYHRYWLLEAKFRGGKLTGVLERGNPDYQPYIHDLAPNCPRYPETRCENGCKSSEVVMSRESKRVDKQRTECVDYFKEKVLNFRLPVLFEMCNNYRMAVIVTQLMSGDASVPELMYSQTDIATLDAYDIANAVRTMRLHRKPNVFFEHSHSIALATVIIFEDQSDFNNTWDYIPGKIEPIVAYLPNTLLIFNEKKLSHDIMTNVITSSDQILIKSEDLKSNVGWQAFSFDYKIKKTVNNVNLKHVMRLTYPIDSDIEMGIVPESCRLCYPNNLTSADCGQCPAIFPYIKL